jgi:hypothetical protein
MALLRLFRTETFKLVAMGFALGTAGVAMTQPSQAQDAAAVTSPAP